MQPLVPRLTTQAGRTDLSEDDKARLMRGQAQHDEVGIEAIEAVARVGIPAGAAALLPDVRHDLVLALPGHICIRQDHLHARETQRMMQLHVLHPAGLLLIGPASPFIHKSLIVDIKTMAFLCKDGNHKCHALYHQHWGPLHLLQDLVGAKQFNARLGHMPIALISCD